MVSSIEYYSKCPSCGATSGNKEVCDYCGSSLIKKRTFENKEVINSLEEQYRIEDEQIPVFKGKGCNRDMFMILFSSIFGGCFLLVPTIILIAFTSSGIMEPFIYPMLLLFMAIGVGSFIPLIRSSIKRSKCKKSPALTGIVRGYTENRIVMVNGSPVKMVRVLVNLPSGPKIAEISTGGPDKPYPVGKMVKIHNYENYFYIEEKERFFE